MCLHYSKARLIANGGRGGGCENIYIYIILESYRSQRLGSEQGKQMQIHHSGVKVKILEVEVKLGKLDASLLNSLSDSGRLKMLVYLHYSQPERDHSQCGSKFRKGESYGEVGLVRRGPKDG